MIVETRRLRGGHVALLQLATTPPPYHPEQEKNCFLKQNQVAFRPLNNHTVSKMTLNPSAPVFVPTKPMDIPISLPDDPFYEDVSGRILYLRHDQSECSDFRDRGWLTSGE